MYQFWYNMSLQFKINTMILTIAFVVGILGQFSSGIPLESPSSDLGQFFDQRIVGGSEAAEGRAPHMAALVVGWSWTSLTCGASIISDSCLLTAAHCVPVNRDGTLMDSFHAIVGSNTWHTGTVVKFASHKLHPHYDPFNIKNDVAVMTTEKKIKMSERVAIIALNYNHVGGGQKSFVTGWGRQSLWGIIPDYLQILYLNTISYEECRKALDEVEAITGYVPPLDPKTEICTLHSVGHGMCHGDSGSGLVSLTSAGQPRGEGKDWIEQLAGLVSWGASPCARGWPDIYMSVHAFRDFIESCLEGRC